MRAVTGLMLLTLVVVLCIAGVDIGRFLYNRSIPSILTVTVDGRAWSSISLDSDNLRGAKPTPHVCCGPAQLKDLEHGMYYVGIRFNDGASLWLSLLHINAGERHKEDVRVTRTGGTARIRCSVTDWPGSGGPEEYSFTTKVKLKDTSQANPFQLE